MDPNFNMIYVGEHSSEEIEPALQLARRLSLTLLLADCALYLVY